VVICLERGADLHMAQLMPLPPTVSCSSKIPIGFTFLVPSHLGSPGQRAVMVMYVCMQGQLCNVFCAVVTMNDAVVMHWVFCCVQSLKL